MLARPFLVCQVPGMTNPAEALVACPGYIAFAIISIRTRIQQDTTKPQHPLLEGQALRFCWDNHIGIIFM